MEESCVIRPLPSMHSRLLSICLCRSIASVTMSKPWRHAGIKTTLASQSYWTVGEVMGYDPAGTQAGALTIGVVQVADAPPVRYGVRQLAAFRIIVLNEDRMRRVELDSDRISCDCGGRKMLSALPFRKVTLPSWQIFALDTVFPRNSYKGIVLFDGTCGVGDTRLVTIRLGSVTFNYLL